MRLLLIGYGKMGKTIERLAMEKGHQIAGRTNSFEELQKFDPRHADVAIEFTTPGSAFDNVRFCLEHRLPTVCGTTGWNDKFESVKKLVHKHKGAFFYASNFSLGVNLYFAMAKRLGTMMRSFAQYEAEIEEIHHLEKKDSPSGTAITLAQNFLETYPLKSGWVSGESDKKEKLSIISQRLGSVPGTHILRLKSGEDLIELVHEAKSRDGFALGAIKAAEWIIGREGFLGMGDMLKLE